MKRTSFRLPVIPPPPEGTASVLVAVGGFQGPFFKGEGAIDLLCGKCLHTLAEALHPGQVQNLVLMCPACGAYNAVVSIRALESFVTQLQAIPAADEKLALLKGVLADAHKKQSTHKDVVALVEQVVPDLTTVKELLVPKTPGDFYGLLGFVVGFLAWLQSRKQVKQKPAVVINNYFSANDPFKGVQRNDPCPCGSGKKYKKCHGK
jgi:hypothetical protein